MVSFSCIILSQSLGHSFLLSRLRQNAADIVNLARYPPFLNDLMLISAGLFSANHSVVFAFSPI